MENLAAAALAQTAGFSWMRAICRWADTPLWFGKTSPGCDQAARGQEAGERRFFQRLTHWRAVPICPVQLAHTRATKSGAMAACAKDRRAFAGTTPCI